MVVVVAVVIWILIGAAVALVMVRKGHSPLIWGSLVLYGPLAGLLALKARDAEEDVPPAEVRHTGRPAGGEVDVVVGIDGSADAREAAERAVGLLGDRLRTVVLATVLDYDITQLPDPSRPKREAGEELDEAAARLRDRFGIDPETVVLTGTPADMLVAHARERGADLLAVGSRGKGLSRVLLGSTASHVAHADVPVLVVHRDGGAHPGGGGAG